MRGAGLFGKFIDEIEESCRNDAGDYAKQHTLYNERRADKPIGGTHRLHNVDFKPGEHCYLDCVWNDGQRNDEQQQNNSRTDYADDRRAYVLNNSLMKCSTYRHKTEITQLWFMMIRGFMHRLVFGGFLNHLGSRMFSSSMVVYRNGCKNKTSGNWIQTISWCCIFNRLCSSNEMVRDAAFIQHNIDARNNILLLMPVLLNDFLMVLQQNQDQA